MKKNFLLTLVLIAGLTLVVSPGAYAAPNPRKALKGVRNAVRSSARRSSSAPFSRSALSRSNRNASPFRGSSPFSSRNNPFRDLGTMSRSHRDMPSPFYSGSRYHRREDSMAKAYRDVGIANAMVGLVGVMATMSQQPTHYVQTPVVEAVPVAVPLAAPIAPMGHWERKPVVVQPQHYEQVQQWVPPISDPRTGEVTGGGYYETRSVLVPERVAYEDVWVPH